MRGAIAGALKKKLGLEVTSEKDEKRGRVYALRSDHPPALKSRRSGSGCRRGLCLFRRSDFFCAGSTRHLKRSCRLAHLSFSHRRTCRICEKTMTKFAKTGGAVSVAVVLTLISSAHAQQYGQCEPERVINSLTTAVLRVAPLFIKPKSQPAPQPIAQTEPPPLGMTREQWIQSLIERGWRFCDQYPDDQVCHR